jgi:hypothetical protein
MRRAALLLLACAAAAQDEARPYGFQGHEIYKLDPKIWLLTPCDVDGDGLEDLLVANNDRARIDVFLRRREPVPWKGKSGGTDVNELVYDRFFERKEVLAEKQIMSLAAADLDADGHLDVAFYGKPEELVVAFGDGKGAFPATRTWALAEGSAVAAGDLNGDGRADLVLLQRSATAILYQAAKGGLAEPVVFPHAEEGASGVVVQDLDGDGRKDLVLLSGSSARSVRVRFQRGDGRLGAELALETTPWRELEVLDIDPSPGAEVVVVQRTSGVLRVLRLARGGAGPERPVPLGSVELHAFEETRGGKPRSMAIGDVDGDGRHDIVVTEPALAQVAVYLQDAQGGLGGRKLFPSLANAEAVRVADLDGDGAGEVLVLSVTERAVGRSRWEKDRLTFPELLKLPGTPKALEAADSDGDGKVDLAVVVEVDDDRKAMLFLRDGSGALAAKPLEVALGSKKKPLDGLLVLDVDHDGRGDLLGFDQFGPLRVWRAVPEGGFKDLGEGGADYRGGLAFELSPGNANRGDLDGDGKPELLVATKNYARALVLEGDPPVLTVKDQANGATPRSQIKGVAALDLDGDGTAEAALYDADKKAVTILKRDDAGVFAVAGNVPVGDFKYQQLFAEDVSGDGRKDLVLFGDNRFGVLYAGGDTWELKELHSVESSVEGAHFGAFAAGDLNGDGHRDLAVLDRGKRAIQVLSYDPQKGFAEQLHFPVYEMKLHEEDRRAEGGAHAIVVADLDGDGGDDVAILVHDRLIAYLQ